MRGRVCVVTGATSGIGRATALALARRGATVVMMARDAARGERVQDELRRESGNDAIELARVDLASLASVREAAAGIATRFPEVHVLIDNAGVHSMRRRASADGFDLTIAVNHLGPFLLTLLLVPRLRAAVPSRIVIVTSMFERFARLADLDAATFRADRAPGAFRSYFRSKLANLLFAFELGRRLEGSGISVHAVHPGLVATSLMRELPVWMRSSYEWLLPAADAGAQPVVTLATAPLPTESGARYVGPHGREARASSRARDAALAARLWEVSIELTGAPAIRTG